MCTRSQAERPACQPCPKRTFYVLFIIKQPHTATHKFPPGTIKLFKKLSFSVSHSKSCSVTLKKKTLGFCQAPAQLQQPWSWYQAAMRPYSAYIVDGNLGERGFWTCPSVHFQVITSWLINTFKTQNMNFPYCSGRSGCQALAIRIMSGEGRGLASTFECSAQETWLTAETAPTSG